ncbi:MAG: hypothetical protein WAV20_21170 [Blastocatellia bacterium]
MIELACPESCAYLIDARVSASQRQSALPSKETNPLGVPDLKLNERGMMSLNAIELAIVNVLRGIGTAASPDIEDSEILAAVENTMKNLETEGSGLIYEHSAGAPRIDQLSRRIREGLDKIGEDLPADARPRRQEILKALSFTREVVRAHIQRAGGDPEASRSFIRYIALFYPWPQDAVAPLII